MRNAFKFIVNMYWLGLLQSTIGRQSLLYKGFKLAERITE